MSGLTSGREPALLEMQRQALMRGRFWQGTAGLLILTPWINPFANGPSAAVQPWLVSAMACCLLLLIKPGIAGTDGVVPGCAKMRWATVVCAALVAAGVLSTGMALLQYFGHTAALAPWINASRPGEAFANLRQRNQFATLTNLAMAALLWFVIRRPGSVSSARYGRSFIFIACLLSVGCAASVSRTGMVELALLGGLCAVWNRWRHAEVRRIFVAAVVSYVIASLALPWLAGLDTSLYGMSARLKTGDFPCSSRLTLWSNVLDLIAQKPWFGWGWNELDYAHYITRYDGPRFCEILDNAHNLPLHLAVELGLPAALCICGLFVWWVMSQRPWREKDPTRQMAWSLIAVMLLHSMLEYPLWYGPFQMTFGIAIVLLWRPRSISQRGVAGNSSWASASTWQWRVPFALIAMGLICYAAFDYHRISQIYLPPQDRDMAYRGNTIEKMRKSLLFRDQARFAELLLTPLAPANAQWTFDTASELLHFSPEPRVIEKLIESSTMLGKNKEAAEHLARYRAAFPEEYANWAKANARSWQR